MKLNPGDLQGYSVYQFNNDEPELDESLDDYYIEDDEDIDEEEELYTHADGYSDFDEDDEDE